MKTIITNLFIVALIATLASCGSNNQATENTGKDTANTTETASSSEEKTNKSTKNDSEASTKSELSFLTNYEGKSPMGEDNFLEKPALKSRIEKLLGDKMKTFTANTQLITPAKLKDGIFVFWGMAQHGGGAEESNLVVDIKKDAIFLGLLSDKKVQIFKEKADVAVPAAMTKWKNEKIETDKAIEVTEAGSSDTESSDGDYSGTYAFAENKGQTNTIPISYRHSIVLKKENGQYTAQYVLDGYQMHADFICDTEKDGNALLLKFKSIGEMSMIQDVEPGKKIIKITPNGDKAKVIFYPDFDIKGWAGKTYDAKKVK